MSYTRQISRTDSLYYVYRRHPDVSPASLCIAGTLPALQYRRHLAGLAVSPGILPAIALTSLLSYYVLRLKLAEPTTSITDFILAAELFAFSFLTFHAGTHQWSVELWGVGLATLGFSALAGGLFHGCAPYFKQPTRTLLWRITVMMVIATLGFMIAAGVISSFSKYPTELLLVAAEIPVLFFLLRTARRPAPNVLVKHSKLAITIAMIGIALLYVRQMYAGGAESGEWILIGSLIILAGIWIQQTEFTLHKHFNQNDLCHLFFMAGVYFLYRGGLLLRDH